MNVLVQCVFQITPWNRVFFEKPISIQLLKRFSAFWGGGGTEGYLPYSHEPSIRSILILSSHQRLDFPIRIFYTFLIYPSTCHILCPSHTPWLDHPNNIWWSLQVMKLLITQSSLGSHQSLPRRSKYSRQYCVPSLVWETKFHTHTQCLRMRLSLRISSRKKCLLWNQTRASWGKEVII
jgi:hypothetical protein